MSRRGATRAQQEVRYWLTAAGWAATGRDEDQVSCTACDPTHPGSVYAHPDEPDPATRWDPCETCAGTGFVPLAAWIGGAA